MKKLSTIKRLLVGALALTMLAGSIAGCGGGDKKDAAKPAAGQTVKINFPTAGASGALYAVGAAITNNWSKTVPGVQAASQASKGGIQNLNLVSTGEAQVSIAISSNVYQCLNGTDSFKGHAYKDLKVIAGLYMNPNQVVVTNKSGINSLADVKGKHFAVAAAGSSVYNECQTHFTAAGLKFPDDIRVENIAFGGAADMLQNGTLDGAWIMSGAPAARYSTSTTQPSTACKRPIRGMQNSPFLKEPIRTRTRTFIPPLSKWLCSAVMTSATTPYISLLNPSGSISTSSVRHRKTSRA